MTFRKEGGVAPDKSSADEITWDYGDDTVIFQRPRSDALSYATTAPPADARTIAVQRALNHALDEWWRRGVLPSNDLLRDGLIVLQAGHDLDESQRTLLLRTALARRRGVLTALRHQTDPERTAVVLAEAILAPTQPLSADELIRLQQGDEQSAAWTPLLVELLRQTLETDPLRRAQAMPALAALTNTSVAAVEAEPTPAASLPWIESEASTPARMTWRRGLLVVALLTIAATLFLWWQRAQAPANMVDVPAGQYLVTAWPAGEPTPVDLAAFRIDRFEATVAQYRTCFERGGCLWPASPASATRPNYLLDPAFADFPMINIDFDDADRFCRFQGKRLPTAAEWEVAAAFAPASGRMFRFPWGDEFAVQSANSAATGIGDTVQVGSFRPAGDSSLGVSDMAGNVAEWTATVVQEDQPLALVRGGSFADDAAALRTTAALTMPLRATAPWLGVRCVADVR